ncbi:MAG: hypothetical protein ACYCWW_00165 [Deltaproteobacteria bacterium]
MADEQKTPEEKPADPPKVEEPEAKPGKPETSADALAQISRRVSAIESGKKAGGQVGFGLILLTCLLTVIVLGAIGFGVDLLIRRKRS